MLPPFELPLEVPEDGGLLRGRPSGEISVVPPSRRPCAVAGAVPDALPLPVVVGPEGATCGLAVIFSRGEFVVVVPTAPRLRGTGVG